MAGKPRGIQILGGLAIVAGYGLGLLLIRGTFVGITRRFNAAASQATWILLGYSLFVAVAAYLFFVGRRALSKAKELPRPESRFGWGRMLLGAIFLYSSAVDHFHLIPPRGIRRLEPTNETQAIAMNITDIIIAFGCILLIMSGIWRGLRSRRT
jgi:hypothetical protein